MKLDDLPIGIKLIGGYILATLLLVVVGWIGFAAMTGMADQTDRMYQDDTVPLTVIGNIEVKLNSIRALTFRSVAIPEENEFDSQRMQADIDSLEANISKLQDVPMTKEQKETFDLFVNQWGTFKSATTQFREALKEGNINAVKGMLASGAPWANARRATDSTFAKMKEIALNQAAENNNAAKSNRDAATIQMVLVILIAGAASIFTGITLTRSITTPLSQVVFLLGRMEKGVLSGRLHLHRGDEIGQMAQSMDQFSDTLEQQIVHRMSEIGEGKRVLLLAARDPDDQFAPAFNSLIDSLAMLQGEVIRLTHAAAAGDLTVRGDISQFKGGYREIIKGFNEALDTIIGPLHEAKRVADEYASGNLTERFSPDVRTEGEFTEFRNSLNKIGVAISAVLDEIAIDMEHLYEQAQNVLVNIEEVSTGSQLLSRTAQKVSISTDGMQSDFSQILKAMEDLSTTVSSVASKTDQVSGLAHQTNDDAQAGTGYVESAENGMKQIADSVHEVEILIQEITREMDEIGSIVNVIGDISEQTNLLALNAAIEAARAGDAGRGFGVVADEVKGLATESRRSTEKVSRIISELRQKTTAVSSAMDGTVKEVKSGNQSVTDTIQSFTRIVSSIQALSNHITDVAAASEEQAASVQEITATLNETNTTVTGLRTDATNAAAESEESTASIDEITKVVDSLSRTTARIKEMISQFRIA